MLHTDPKIIRKETFQLLKKLQKDSFLDQFFLVGGTSLALQMGHRHSIDLDLFSTKPFDQKKALAYLDQHYSFEMSAVEDNTILGFIENIKVDFISHQYPLVYPLLKVDEIRLASMLDVAAMKFNAIIHSGQRQKDFYDMYFLLEHYSLSEMLASFSKKYPRSSSLMALRALAYFDEIRFEIEPPELVRNVSFDQVMARLIESISSTDKVFSQP